MGAIMASATKLYLLQGRLSPYVFNRPNGSVAGTFGKRGQSGCYALLTPDARLVRGNAKVHGAGYELAEHDTNSKDRIATHPNARRLVISTGTAYILTATSLSAVNRADGAVKWSVTCDCPHALILAGDVLFAGGTNKDPSSNSNGAQPAPFGESDSHAPSRIFPCPLELTQPAAGWVGLIMLRERTLLYFPATQNLRTPQS